LFTKADAEGNDAILGSETDNEFGSDVAVVLRNNNNVHFLGTQEDMDAFSKFVNRQNVSKVVDENGEPLVVWHGSKLSNNINVFYNKPTYFSNRYTAFSYTPFDAEDETEYMYPCFLNVKNPKEIEGEGSAWNDINGQSTDEIVSKLGNKDGAIISNIKDYSDFTPGNPDLSKELIEDAPLHTDYVVTNPNQIKSAVANSGEFSKTNNNIYQESFNQKETEFFVKDTFLKQAYDDRLHKDKHLSIDDVLSYLSKSNTTAPVVNLINFINKEKNNGLIP